MSEPNDKTLGMDRVIGRRDFIHGMAALGVGALGAPSSFEARATASPYPPGLAGLRGSHDGSFEVAHRVAWQAWRDWGPAEDSGDGVVDLVIVGAGVSGLAAAHFYRKRHPSARIVILDNHDDFGGHAKRNEFRAGDRMVLGHGGSQTLEQPHFYSKVARGLLEDLGIDLDRFETAYDHAHLVRDTGDAESALHGDATPLFLHLAS